MRNTTAFYLFLRLDPLTETRKEIAFQYEQLGITMISVSNTAPRLYCTHVSQLYLLMLTCSNSSLITVNLLSFDDP